MRPAPAVRLVTGSGTGPSETAVWISTILLSEGRFHER
jgi:hypothetical protein